MTTSRRDIVLCSSRLPSTALPSLFTFKKFPPEKVQVYMEVLERNRGVNPWEFRTLVDHSKPVFDAHHRRSCVVSFLVSPVYSKELVKNEAHFLDVFIHPEPEGTRELHGLSWFILIHWQSGTHILRILLFSPKARFPFMRQRKSQRNSSNLLRVNSFENEFPRTGFADRVVSASAPNIAGIS